MTPRLASICIYADLKYNCEMDSRKLTVGTTFCGLSVRHYTSDVKLPNTNSRLLGPIRKYFFDSDLNYFVALH